MGKRNFRIISEPSGGSSIDGRAKAHLLYVVQSSATQLHYDFRLEWNGVLLSWADPSMKRLAMQVEDHPREYGGFGGVISESEYGGGTVMVWDKGEWSPGVEDVTAALAKGDLKFTPYGKKLRGSWVLVRTRGFGSKADKSWLLIEHRDPYACKKDITAEQPGSVVSKRLFADIASDESGDVAKAATGDAQPKRQSRPRTTSPNRKKRGQS